MSDSFICPLGGDKSAGWIHPWPIWSWKERRHILLRQHRIRKRVRHIRAREAETLHLELRHDLDPPVLRSSESNGQKLVL